MIIITTSRKTKGGVGKTPQNSNNQAISKTVFYKKKKNERLDVAATEDEEEAEHGDESEGLKCRDKAPKHAVHDRELDVRPSREHGPVGRKAREVEIGPSEDGR